MKPGPFSIYKQIRKISTMELVPFATSSIRRSRGTPDRFKDRERYGTGDKNNKAEKSVNGSWEHKLLFPH